MTTRTTKTPARLDADGVTERLHGAADPIAELTEAAVRALVARLDALGKAMQGRPVLAIGVGIAAGYVLARLLRRG